MFDQAPGFMAMLRGPEHVFELCNPAYKRLVGDRELLGKTVAEALPDAVEQGYLKLLDQVYLTGQAFTFVRLEICHADDARRPGHRALP